ncbi:ABC transporter substrate-binding protein [Microbacterium kribbense]|uniref:ABC transporter substrate-binding protein n=1 Tax=Microbacterium kribbense TaxID=433645 RepID=A0ABP7G2U2_9MICO
MKSCIKGIGVLAIATLALAGCAAGGGGGDNDQTSNTGKKISLEFETGLATGDPAMKELTTLADKYHADHANVTINLVPLSGDYEANMKVRMASGNLPDLWSTHGWSLLRYSPFLQELNDQPWAKNFNDALAPAMKSKDGKFYALPITTDISGIVYNKTVLKDNGIDPTTLKTWADFDAALATLKKAGIIPLSSSGKDNWFAGDVADFMASGAFDDATLKQFTDGTFVSDQYVKVLDEVQKWSKAKYFNPDYSSIATDGIARSLAEGKTAFVFIQNTLVANALTFNPNATLGFMPIPNFTGTPFLVGGEGTAYGVWKNSPNKQAALDFLAFIAEPAHLGEFATALNSEPGLTDATSDLGPLQDSFDQFAKGGTYPLWPYFDRVYLPNGSWDTMVSTTDSVITGQSHAQDATKKLADTFKSLFGQK